MNYSSPNYEVTIDRLVLDGITVAPRQRDTLRGAVQSELSRLLRDGGIGPRFAGGGATARLGAPSVRVSTDGDPAALGREIARAVYGGIGQC